jgi:hypothetical protein
MSKDTYDPVADEGIYTVGRIFSRDFGWAFRPQPIADFGIDAHVEVCKSGKPVGKILAVQLKSGESYFQEKTKNGYVYRGSPRHLEYWLNYPLPCVLILYNPATQQVHWQAITHKNVEKTGKRWKLIVPYKQSLDSDAVPTLLALIEGSANFLDESITENIDEVSSATPISIKSEIVREDIVRGALEEVVTHVKQDVEIFTVRMWDHEIPLGDWQLEMISAIKKVFVCQYAAAKGGFESINKADWERLAPVLRQQFKSLMGFAFDLEKGRYNDNEIREIVKRAYLFIESSTIAFEMGKAAWKDRELIYIKMNKGWNSKLQKKSSI